MNHRRMRVAMAISAIGAAVGVALPARAGGFFNVNQSATAAGSAVAGETAAAANAATVFYNPAGMVFLDRPEVLASVGLIMPSSSFQNRGSTDAAGLPAGGTGATNDTLGAQPLIFGTVPVNDRIALGLGVSVPFGQQTKYADNWVGRYQVQQVSLKTISVRPALAYRVNDWLSIGGAIDVQYAEFKSAQAIDFGALLGAPEAVDGRLSLALDGWAIGYDLGLIVQPWSGFRLGLNFRSGAQYRLSGTARFNVPLAAAPVAAGGAFRNTTAQGGLALPPIVSAGASYRIGDDWTALVDVSWMQWSVLKTLALGFANPTPPVNLPLQWHDSVRAAVGAAYRLNEMTDLRAGVAYDQTPVPDMFRAAELPQGDSIDLSLGIARRLSDRLSVTVSYSYNHGMSAPLNVKQAGAGTLLGTAQQDGHALGFEARLQF